MEKHQSWSTALNMHHNKFDEPIRGTQLMVWKNRGFKPEPLGFVCRFVDHSTPVEECPVMSASYAKYLIGSRPKTKSGGNPKLKGTGKKPNQCSPINKPLNVPLASSLQMQ
ncbi:hypothetical protein VPHK225_0041 [Vibrio phage K225]